MVQSFDFAQRFSQLSGIAHTVDSEETAADAIAAIVAKDGADCVALAGLPPDFVAAVAKRCAGVTVLTEPYAAGDLPGAIDRAQVGVTGIAFGIAQSGTLVEVATNDAVRLVSALPRTYIGVIRKSTIVDRFDRAAAEVRRIVARHDRNLTLSFISGPSRTGDIEMKLTLGVHGPEKAHAIIIDDG